MKRVFDILLGCLAAWLSGGSDLVGAGVAGGDGRSLDFQRARSVWV